MIIRNHPITPRRGNEHLAQGIALGKQWPHIVRPVGATASMCSGMRAFALAGRYLIAYNIPRALPGAMSLLALQAVYQVYADNHFLGNLTQEGYSFNRFLGIQRHPKSIKQQ